MTQTVWKPTSSMQDREAHRISRVTGRWRVPGALNRGIGVLLKHRASAGSSGSCVEETRGGKGRSGETRRERAAGSLIRDGALGRGQLIE